MDGRPDNGSRARSHLVVVGLGYVGLPLAQAAAAAGLRVTGYDVAAGVVAGLRAGRSHVDDLSDQDIRAALDRGFTATTDPSVIGDADAVVLCVPTPLSGDGRPDLDAVTGAVDLVARHLRRRALVVLESTTFPGTTEDVVLPMLQAGGLMLGEDFNLAFSPERIDPGNTTYDIRNTPKVVGGVTAECTRLASEFYGTFVDTVVKARGPREAETAKLLENTYRHINIALVNEMARVCHELDIDIWNVVECARTKPFGFEAFYPGPGVGGHCIPIDPNYLSYAIKSRLGYPLRFVELAQEINNSMPQYVARRIQDLLNDDAIAVRGARVLLVGVTYKRDIADQRESPADAVVAQLASMGAELAYHDPYVPEWKPRCGVSIRQVDDISESLDEFDAVVVLQHHSNVDLDIVGERHGRVLDTRGKMTHKGVSRL
jgi:UDP-N-acetyl-D-glucosamine dehydrogenase